MSRRERIGRDIEAEIGQLAEQKALAVQRAKVEIETIDAQIQALEHARLVLAVEQNGHRPERTEPKRKRKSAKAQAGPGNVARLYETLLARATPSTQAELARAARLNDGTTSYAIRALVEEGRVRKLGEGRGARFEVVSGERRTVVRPRR